jgi:glycerol-3-phosphate cytidylyltransferase
MIVGYTSGVFDLFHIGHLNLLRNAKALCDKLVVGVTTDELVGYKFKRAVIPFTERLEIVRAIEYVDAVIPQESMDKLEVWDKVKFDIMFVGDDWYETDKWQSIESEFAERNVKVVYFPYTKSTSSSLINETLLNLRKDSK